LCLVSSKEFELQLVYELVFEDCQNVAPAHWSQNFEFLLCPIHWVNFPSSLSFTTALSTVPKLLALSPFVLATTQNQKRFYVLACLPLWQRCYSC